MKKITYSLLALLILVGCQEDEWMGNGQRQEIRVTASLPVTRTAFTEEGNVTHVSWEKDDDIRICTKEQTDLWYKAKEAGRSTEFYAVYSSSENKLQAADGDSVFACYPRNYSRDGDPYHIESYNGSQKYGEKITDRDFIYAADVVKNGQVNLQFKHLYAFLKLTIPTELIPDRGEYGGLDIESTEDIGGETIFDLQKGEIVSKGTAKSIIYQIADSVQSKEVTCYIAILPQSENAEIRISHRSDFYTKDRLLTKKAPAGGFKAGNVYTLYLNENETEAQKRIDREALIAFYKATGGDNWTHKDNWCSDKPIEEWYGINKRAEGTYLDLQNNNLDDSNYEGVGLSLLCECTDLVSIILSNNPKLSGTIPAEIGNLKQLSSLFLADCGLTGEVPSDIIKLSKLNYLYLAHNSLEGEFPDLTFLNSNAVCDIAIDNNKFTGKLPDIPTAESFYLRRFTANNNNFTGDIPKSHAYQMTRTITGVVNYTGCEYDVSNNKLSGTLPDEIVKDDNFHSRWFNILMQQAGYGFKEVDIPAHRNKVECTDGSFLDLGEEYQKHEYTLLFRWSYDTSFSKLYARRLESLRKAYENKGLGIVCMTPIMYSDAKMEYLTKKMPTTKIFRETNVNEMGNKVEAYENNPYNNWSLFRFEDAAPLFFIVDKQGEIVYICGDNAIPMGVIPQYSDDILGVLKYVAQLFGDSDFKADDPFYTSTDYSYDGEVVKLQTATVSKGIDLVFMGEGFVDKDMEKDGVYEQRMKKAVDDYFAYEPYKTFRNRFNCYAVKVVSPNEEFEEDGVQRIMRNNGLCFRFANMIPNINKDKFYISVVYKNPNYNDNYGRSVTSMFTDGSFVGYMLDGNPDVLTHEVCGHGFAKLMDEYVEGGYENETLPEDDKETMDYQWQTFGWGANVDWRNDKSTVKWSRLLNDSRYASEGLGLYEGANLYGYGCYRPTENSMMRYNDCPFNAPSREQIYKRIMQESEGEGWTYDYEEFVKIDAVSRTSATTRALQTEPSAAQKQAWKQRHHPPVIIKGTWRDAVKEMKEESIIVPLR